MDLLSRLDLYSNWTKQTTADLHAPDYKTPWTKTAHAMGTLQKEGKFSRWGVSNFSSSSIEEMVTYCKQNDLPLPSVYQGL